MRDLGQVAAVQADYTEVVESVLLEQALTSSGRLDYRAPDQVIKTSERGEIVAIEGDSIEVRRGESSRRFEIADHQGVETLVLALRATLAGDLDRLLAAYAVTLQTEATTWTLELRPRERRLLPFFERIEIAGMGNRVDRVDIVESNGDRRNLRLRNQRIALQASP